MIVYSIVPRVRGFWAPNLVCLLTGFTQPGITRYSHICAVWRLLDVGRGLVRYLAKNKSEKGIYIPETEMTN